MYSIDHNIPYPGNPGGSKYPWREMQVGDSVHFGPDEYNRARAAASSHQSANRDANGAPTIVFKGICEPGNGGRIWRVA